MERGKLFYVSRFFVRLGVGRWRAEVPAPEGPTVYVCSHRNLLGPLVTLCWLPFPVRPWVLHVFCNRETCRRQYQSYTFSKRFGIPGPAAAFAAWAAAGYVSGLMKSLCAIPVYRGTVRIGDTFKETVSALRAEDGVLVFPDVVYTDSSSGIGEVYDGFLLIERFWRKKSDVPLHFVPLRMEGRAITAGRPVCFDRAAPWKTELPRVREALREEINQK